MSGRRWAKLAASARGALFSATDLAEQRGAGDIRSEHLLGGILMTADPVIAKVLNGCGVTPDALRDELAKRLPPPTSSGAQELPLHACTKAAIDAAIDEARALKHYDAAAGHLLLGLAKGRDSTARILLAMHGVHAGAVRDRLAELIPALPRPPVRLRQLEDD